MNWLRIGASVAIGIGLLLLTLLFQSQTKLVVIDGKIDPSAVDCVQAQPDEEAIPCSEYSVTQYGWWLGNVHRISPGSSSGNKDSWFYPCKVQLLASGSGVGICDATKRISENPAGFDSSEPYWLFLNLLINVAVISGVAYIGLEKFGILGGDESI